MTTEHLIGNMDLYEENDSMDCDRETLMVAEDGLHVDDKKTACVMDVQMKMIVELFVLLVLQ